MLKSFFLFLILVTTGFVSFFTYQNKSKPETDYKTEVTTGTSSKTDLPKKTPHWESNIPEHNQTLPASPINIVVNFNFDLSKKSTINITKDGKDYGVGETFIDSSNLALRKSFAQNAPDGIYTVNYIACWPDNSCHEGNFKFVIDSAKLNNFIDLTGQKEITIYLNEIKFDPVDIKISMGTKITWVNNELVGHYINTDPHPGHNYYPDLNSKYMQKGDAYSYIFNSKGYYPYHCSAHADSMKGSIIVE